MCVCCCSEDLGFQKTQRKRGCSFLREGKRGKPQKSVSLEKEEEETDNTFVVSYLFFLQEEWRWDRHSLFDFV